MIGYKADRNIIHCICLIRLAGKLTDPVSDSFHCINIKYGIHILHYNGKTLKPHTGIYVFVLKFRVSTVSVTVELCEHVVPDFHKTVTVAANLAVRLSAAVFLASVIVDLRARTAGTCSMLPEVIALSGLGITVKSCDPLGRNTDLLIPDLESLVILTVN